MNISCRSTSHAADGEPFDLLRGLRSRQKHLLRGLTPKNLANCTLSGSVHGQAPDTCQGFPHSLHPANPATPAAARGVKPVLPNSPNRQRGRPKEVVSSAHSLALIPDVS